MDEDDHQNVRVSAYVDRLTHDKITAHAQARGLSESAYVRTLVLKGLED